MAEKCRSFLEYRNPSSEMDDEPMGTDDNFNSTALDRHGTASSVASGKRKFCFDDYDEVEYEVTELITEKFRKTDEVPDHGSHAPIALIDDEQFARLIQIESPSKTPIPGNSEERNNNGTADSSNDSMQEVLDRVEDESTVATTPTNPSCMQQMFEAFEHDEPVDQDSPATLKQRLLKKVSTRKCAIRKTNNEYPTTPFHYFERSNLNLDLAAQPKSDAAGSH